MNHAIGYMTTEVISAYFENTTLTPDDAVSLIPQVRQFFESYLTDYPEEVDKLERTTEMFCSYVHKNHLDRDQVVSFLNSIIESIP